MCRNGTTPLATTTLSSTVRMAPLASFNLSGALNAATEYLKSGKRTEGKYSSLAICAQRCT